MNPRSRSVSTTAPCGTSIATWISSGLPPLVAMSQSHICASPSPLCAKVRLPSRLPLASVSQTSCFWDAQSTPANQLWISSIDFPPPFEPPRHLPVPVLALNGAFFPLGILSRPPTGAHVPCRRSPEIRGAGSKRLLPAGGSAREGYADLLALAVLRSATLHFTQPAQQPPKPLENSTGPGGTCSAIAPARPGRGPSTFPYE